MSPFASRRALVPALFAAFAFAAGCGTVLPSAPGGPPAEPVDSTLVILAGVPAPRPNLRIAGADEVEAGVRAVLDAQVAAWNAGDLRRFMDGYSRYDTTMAMYSDGQMRSGWEANFYAYVRGYPDRAAMGTLSFENLMIRALSPDWAFVTGRFRLRRAADEPIGLFSLVLHREVEWGWRIVHDHTSSSP